MEPTPLRTEKGPMDRQVLEEVPTLGHEDMPCRLRMRHELQPEPWFTARVCPIETCAILHPGD
jgi:hypothetical protein